MKGVVFDSGRYTVTDGLDVRWPNAGEVLVRISSAGLCHSDISVIDGTIRFPTPVVLGHEAAGIVERVGEGVDHVKVGDHVVLSTLGNCGHCAACDAGRPTHCRRSLGQLQQPFTLDGTPTYSFANVSAFAELTVVAANQAVPIPTDVPLPVAALVGCGVITGVGAVLNRADVREGSSVAVFGVGGIGLNVIQACRLRGATTIVAVDTVAAKESLARQFGATGFLDAGGADAVEAIKQLVPGGVDYAFECVGHPAVIRQAIDVLGWGGSCVILGVPGAKAEASFNVASLYVDKSIMGCRYGSARPQHDVPLIIELYRSGRLMLDELVTATYPIDDIGRAIGDLHDGKLARGVLQL
jgi:S-(hydroxymethyl)glutathione dehydrogenase/alcohol dehydrogenase